MSKRVIRWSDLGSPTEPGTYRVSGVGDVTVEQSDIDRASELDGDPRLEINESIALHDEVRNFVAGLFFPSDEIID